MQLTLADITPSRLKFNSHKVHNPSYDILELHISRDAFITYAINLKTGMECMEYYSGSNYVPASILRSVSRNYNESEIPKKYKPVWNGLREYYQKHFANK